MPVVKPYNQNQPKKEQVAEMFNNIALHHKYLCMGMIYEAGGRHMFNMEFINRVRFSGANIIYNSNFTYEFKYNPNKNCFADGDNLTLFIKRCFIDMVWSYEFTRRYFRLILSRDIAEIIAQMLI